MGIKEDMDAFITMNGFAHPDSDDLEDIDPMVGHIEISVDDTVIELFAKVLSFFDLDQGSGHPLEVSAAIQDTHTDLFKHQLNPLLEDLKGIGYSQFNRDVFRDIRVGLMAHGAPPILNFVSVCDELLAPVDRKVVLAARYLLTVSHALAAEYCSQAGNREEAWKHLCTANYWFGRFRTSAYSYRTCISKERSDIARRGGTARAERFKGLESRITQLLADKVPSRGWKSMREAAEEIYPEIDNEFNAEGNDREGYPDLMSKIYRRIAKPGLARDAYDKNSIEARRWSSRSMIGIQKTTN